MSGSWPVDMSIRICGKSRKGAGILRTSTNPKPKFSSYQEDVCLFSKWSGHDLMGGERLSSAKSDYKFKICTAAVRV